MLQEGRSIFVEVKVWVIVRITVHTSLCLILIVYGERFVWISNLLVKRVFFFLLTAAFAMAILDLISRVHLPSFVNMLPKYHTKA